MPCHSLLKTFTLKNAVAEVWDYEGSYNLLVYPKRGIDCPTTFRGGHVMLMFSVMDQGSIGEMTTDLDDLIAVTKMGKRWVKEAIREDEVSFCEQTIEHDDDPEATSYARRKLASLNRRSA